VLLRADVTIVMTKNAGRKLGPTILFTLSLQITIQYRLYPIMNERRTLHLLAFPVVAGSCKEVPTSEEFNN
jgi:hypothetical protein